MVALIAAGALLRGLGVALLGLDHPFGEDAGHWAHRALALRDQQIGGAYAPGHPLVALAISGVTGLPVVRAAWGLSLICGALGPAAIGAGVASAFGRRAGILCGVGTLLLPNILAWSLRIEPTSLYVVLLGLLLLSVGRAARLRSLRWALAAAAATLLLIATKESGLLYIAPIAAALLLRGRRTGGLYLGVTLLGLVALRGLDSPAPGEHSARDKVALPVLDLQRMIGEGVLPKPLRATDDPVLIVPPAVVEAARAATPPARLWTWAQLQVSRLTRFLGLWALVALLGARAAFIAWRRGRLAVWEAILLLGLSAPLAACLVVVVQPRHAEAALIGAMIAPALLTPPRWLPALGAVLALQGAGLLVTLEWPRAQKLHAIGAAWQAAGDRLEAHIDEGDRVCSSEVWIGVVLDRAVPDCAQVPAGRWFAIERAITDGGVRQIFTEGPDPGPVPLTRIPWTVLADLSDPAIEDVFLYAVSPDGSGAVPGALIRAGPLHGPAAQR